jgi:hypothetical protein
MHQATTYGVTTYAKTGPQADADDPLTSIP